MYLPGDAGGSVQVDPQRFIARSKSLAVYRHSNPSSWCSNVPPTPTPHPCSHLVVLQQWQHPWQHVVQVSKRAGYRDCQRQHHWWSRVPSVYQKSCRYCVSFCHTHHTTGTKHSNIVSTGQGRFRGRCARSTRRICQPCLPCATSLRLRNQCRIRYNCNCGPQSTVSRVQCCWGWIVRVAMPCSVCDWIAK